MILVLGASGHIGTHLVEELKSRNARFRAAYRSAEQVAGAGGRGVEAVRADYGDAASLDSAMRGVERVFLVYPSAADLEPMESAVVQAAGRAGVRHLVKISVVGAAEAEFIFARPHQAVERLIERSGLRSTFLRPHNFMQNLLNSAPIIRETGVFALPDGGRNPSVDVRDVARVAATVLLEQGHEGRTYTLTGPEAQTDADRMKILSEVVGRPIRYVAPPDDEWRKMALGFGLPEYLVDAVVDLQQYMRREKVSQVTPDVERLTGQAPLTFRRFAEDHASAFR